VLPVVRLAMHHLRTALVDDVIPSERLIVILSSELASVAKDLPCDRERLDDPSLRSG